MRAKEFINESKTTLNNMYGGHFPDRDEEFWDYVTPRELGQALTVETMQKHKVLIMLLSQYRAEHIDDITDMLDDDQQEIVQSYVNDPTLSSKTIVVANNKIIDGNHRALAAAIKGVPINYVDLAELDEEPIDESTSDAAKSWIEKVYAKYPHTMQNNHVMVWGEGDDQQFAMFELTPSFSKRGAVEVKWFQAYPLRQGVGSRAMKELQALAREDGITLTLFPWDKGQVSQAKLTKFYKGQGFTPTVKGGKAMAWSPELNEELRVDVPNEEWLQDAIDYAKSKSPDRNGLPYMGKTTATVRNVDVPLSILRRIPGMRQEQSKIRHHDLAAIRKIMSTTGKLPLHGHTGQEYKPFINVAYDGSAWVNEGNHRIMAAAELGWDSLPVEISYFDGGERIKDGAMYPGRIGLGEPPLDEAEVGTTNAKTIANQLKAAGYSNVGTGADSTVWAKDDSHVIKILMPEDAGSKAEQVFRKFYEFAMSHQDLPCVPRFNEVNTVDINGKDYTQIEMERLSPIEKGGFLQGMIWLLSDYVSKNTPWPTVESELTDERPWYFFSPNYSGTFARTWKSLVENPASEKTYSMYKQLYTVMKLLYNTGSINEFGWDLHTANVMQRSNGQPVIIDPWFSEGTS